VVLGFLLMGLEVFLPPNYMRDGSASVIAGLVLLLGGVATAFAKDADGKERLVEDIVRESHSKKQS